MGKGAQEETEARTLGALLHRDSESNMKRQPGDANVGPGTSGPSPAIMDLTLSSENFLSRGLTSPDPPGTCGISPNAPRGVTW